MHSNLLRFISFTFFILFFSNTIYAQKYSFKNGPSVTDTNGNMYPSIITSCGQIWTTDNLSVSRYRNGDVIPQVTDENQWQKLTTGAWCWYENDSVKYWHYGKLYNWYAVNDPRGLAPQGWHVPSDPEWNKFVKCIDFGADTTTTGSQSATAGQAMKEAGTSHWMMPNSGANNSSGFTGLPAGIRNFSKFKYIRNIGFWWSNTEVNSSLSCSSVAWSIGLSYGNDDVSKYYSIKLNGFSVRLIKD